MVLLAATGMPILDHPIVATTWTGKHREASAPFTTSPINLISFPVHDYLNPIEYLWCKVKVILKSIAARTTEALHRAIGIALSVVTESDLRGRFQHRRIFSMTK